VTRDVRIRRPEPHEANAVAAVFIASFGTLTFLPKLHTDEETVDFITNIVLREQEVFVADLDGRIAGFVAMSNGDFLEHLYVHPDQQGRGVGSALLRRAKERMLGGFRLWVFQANERARQFYERHGLRIVELTDGSANEEKTPDALYAWEPDDTDAWTTDAR
jgi:ribosomal protein S18 acetylase RimI-like enzyme